MNKSDYICKHHEYIITEAEEILSASDNIKFFINKIIQSHNSVDNEKQEWQKNFNEKEVLNSLKDIKNAVYKIKKSAQIALEQGQAMENRLKKYRDAIEGLGFTRKT